MLRLLGKAQVRCAYIPEVLVKMRLGGASNCSLGNIIRKTKENYRALKKDRIGGRSRLV